MDHCEISYKQNFSSDESEMMLQWLGSQYFNPDLLPLHEDSSNNSSSPNLDFYNADPYNNNLYESNPINCSFLASLGYDAYHHGMECMSEDHHAMSYLDDGANQQLVSQVLTNEMVELTENVVQPNGKRKLELNCYEKETNEESDEISNNVPRKKSRTSVRATRSAKSSKEEGSNGESSLFSSEDESNGESNANYNSKKNSNGKSKRSATDPQSIYAKKRREKINQRLRILQTLVPNGTKVDISTMLEDAVQYVKFLQTQIKLLSSDDLWMYAPLAYNGVNINCDLSI